MNGEPMPILFLLGPSGVGKSTLSGWVGDDLSFLHLEIDRAPEDGIDHEHLRAEWDSFWIGGDAQPLATVLNARAVAANRRGVILSFPSDVAPSQQQLMAATAAGIRVLVLYGTGAECLEAFLRREQELGRGLGVDHWMLNNAQTYARFSDPAYSAHRVLAFDRGRFRSRGAMVREVRQRAG